MEGKILRDSYLLWIKQQRDNYAQGTFGCNWEDSHSICDYVFGRTDVNYYEIMEYIIRNTIITDKQVKEYWDSDKEYIRQIREGAKSQGVTVSGNKFFITITTDKTRATPVKLYKFVLWLRDKCKWVKSMSAVIENHRESGILLHTHIILETTEESELKYGSKVKDKLWSLKPIKEMLGGSNYIDYMYYSPDRHDKYITGNKCDAKKPLVEKDKIWRKENHIPDLIEKK